MIPAGDGVFHPDAEPVLLSPDPMTPGSGSTARRGPPRRLGDLLDALSGAVGPGHAHDAEITGIVTRSEDVRPGSLFVALPGSAADGHTFIADAARRGAAAILVERDVGGALDAPLVRVPDVRRALADLAAEWHGRPADRLMLIGITGTAGKTSTLALLEAALVADGARVGTIGSLGLHVQGRSFDESVYTTPDPLLLHQELARVADAGSDMVAMEATSHALAQGRVHGLRFRLGVFTNLLPLEHADYHEDFESYVRAKCLFFDHLEPGAPIIYNRDDPVTRVVVAARRLNEVPVGSGRRAVARISDPITSPTGTRFTLDVAGALPRMDGGVVEPVRLDVRLRLLGPANRMNAALAATCALCAGADPAAVLDALSHLDPPHRRLQVVHRGRFTLLDDTVGHPESISAFFDVVARLRPRHVHLAYAVRGQRGESINRHNAETLAIWAERLGIDTLVVTRSEGMTDELNHVEAAEYRAFVDPLRARGLTVRELPRLEEAVHAVLERAEDGDLVALLGAQGMDPGQELARAWLRDRGEKATPVLADPGSG
jgi:UDP-N-acetylmuramoyl-L-alanyl-D-glutamate--2,6-diaminopimelate ligase